MTRDSHLVAFVLVIAVLMAVPAIGVADEPDADANETDSGEDEGMSPGERLAGAMGVQESEIDGDIEQRTFETRAEGAADDEARATLADEQVEQVETELNDLEEQAKQLEEEFESGEITESQFHRAVAQLRVDAESKADLAERAAEIAGETGVVEEQEETVAKIVDIRVRAEQVTDSDDEAVNDLIEPTVQEDPEEAVEEEAETVAERLASSLERADRQTQETDSTVRDTVDLPDEVAGEEYEISVREASEGGVVQIIPADSDVRVSSEFRAGAIVPDTDLAGGPVSYAAETDELAVFEEDDEDEDDRDDRPDRAEREAATVGDRLATVLERADRSAHETDGIVSDRVEFPETIDGSSYTVSVQADGDDGLIEVEAAADVSYSTTFSARAPVQETQVDGGPVGYTASPDELVVGERADDRDDPAEDEAAEIGDRLATTLEEADRLAHQTDNVVRGEVNLPEEIAGDEHTIAVGGGSDGGIVEVAAIEGDVRYTTEFRARASVEDVQSDSGELFYRADTDDLAVFDREEDEEDDEDAGDDELAVEKAQDVGDRLAMALEEADQYAQEAGSEISAGFSLPEEINDESYTIAVAESDTGGMIEVEATDGVSYSTAFSAHASVRESEIEGGPVTYSADAERVSVTEADQRERDDREEDYQEARDQDAQVLVEELSEQLESADEHVQRAEDVANGQFNLPDTLGEQHYELRIETHEDGGEITVIGEDGDQINRGVFDIGASVEDAHFEGGVMLAYTANPEEFAFGEADDYDDRGDRDDAAEERAAEGLAEEIEQVDDYVQDTGTTHEEAFETPRTLGEQRYELTIEADEEGGEITIIGEDDEQIDRAAFDIEASVDGTHLEGGATMVYTAGPDVFDFAEGDERDHDDHDDHDHEDRDRDDETVEDVAFVEELAEEFELVDERVQETDSTLRNGIDLPRAVDDQRYELIIEASEKGGQLTVIGEDGDRIERAAFDVEASVEDANFEGGTTIVYSASPDVFGFVEGDDHDSDRDDHDDHDGDHNDKDDRISEHAKEISDRVAATLEDADRQAHERGETISDQINLPEDLEGDDYTISVRSEPDSTLVGVAVADRELHTVEIDPSASVEDVRLDGGPVDYTANPDELVVGVQEVDDRDDDDHEDEERHEEESEDDSDDTHTIAQDLADEFEAADERVQETDSRITEELDLPETVSDQRYELTIETRDDRTRITAIAEDGDRIDTASVDVEASVVDAHFEGGTTITYRASPDELAFEQ